MLPKSAEIVRAEIECAVGMVLLKHVRKDAGLEIGPPDSIPWSQVLVRMCRKGGSCALCSVRLSGRRGAPESSR